MLTPTSSGGDAITMTVLADKVARGGRLTASDQGLVITNAARVYSGQFGPSPADMRISPNPLPENVKGVLASFSL
jgi:hypothetical protein